MSSIAYSVQKVPVFLSTLLFIYRTDPHNKIASNVQYLEVSSFDFSGAADFIRSSFFYFAEHQVDMFVEGLYVSIYVRVAHPAVHGRVDI